jgi:hypothetical protein
MLARKPVAVGAAAVLSAGLFAAAAHGTGSAKVDVSHDTISCTTVYGAATFSPPLKLFPSPDGQSKVSIKGTAKNCTVSGPHPAVVLSGTFAGTLTIPSQVVTSLLGLESTGTTKLTIKWKADKSTPLLQSSTVLMPKAICGGTIALPAPLNASTYAQFHFGAQPSCGGDPQPASSATGAFVGNDDGAGSITDAITSQQINPMIGQATSTGVSTVNIGLGTLTIG